MVDVYYTVDVGWTEYIVGGDSHARRDLQNLAKQYPGSRVRIYSKLSHELWYEKKIEEII